MAQKKEHILELEDGEMWTDFLLEIDRLMHEEKRARQENDHVKLGEICSRIATLSFENKEYSKLMKWLLLLTKRRGQAKRAVTEMVKTCMGLVEKMPSRDLKYELLSVIREATNGKMYVEEEYPRATRQYCEMLEEDGKTQEATKIVQEVQIETFGSINQKYKVDYILYQMRMVLTQKDYIRCQIIAKKLSKKHLAAAGFEREKVHYYGYLLYYYIHEKDTLETCRCYKTMYDTLDQLGKEISADE